MTSRARALASTSLLLAVAGGVLLYGWFGIARKDEERQARESSQAKLYDFAPSTVSGITVEAKGEVTRLARSGDGWRVEAPVQAQGERAAAEAIVNRMADLRRTSLVAGAPPTDALARYGLERPRATVKLTLAGGKAESLALGDENTFDGTAFVRDTSGAVALVPGDIRWTIEKSTFDLRDKRLLPFEDKDVARLEVTTPRLSYALVREGSAAWRLDAPVKDEADPATAGRVLGAVRGLRATAFHRSAGEQASRAPGGQRWRVTLVAPDGSRRSLTLSEGPSPSRSAAAPGRGQVAPALLARVEGSGETATVAPGTVKDLEQDLDALRAKRVPPTAPESRN
jgi:hypothetical protein